MYRVQTWPSGESGLHKEGKLKLESAHRPGNKNVIPFKLHSFQWAPLLPRDHESIALCLNPVIFIHRLLFPESLCPQLSYSVCPQTPPPSVAYIGQSAWNGRVWILHAMCIANIPQDLCHWSLWKWQMVGMRAKRGSKNKSNYDSTKGGPVPVPRLCCDILGSMDLTRQIKCYVRVFAMFLFSIKKISLGKFTLTLKS